MSFTAFLIALAGGALVSLSLYYPLYYYLPGLLVTDWLPAQFTPALICVALALALFCVTGYMSARWSGMTTRWGNAKAGFASGFIAAVLAFAVIVSPAAGVWGNRSILLHGLTPAGNDVEFVTLVYEATLGTIQWTVTGFLATVLCGSLLGALGGSLRAPQAAKGNDWADLSIAVSPALIIFSFLNVIVTFSTFYILEGILVKTREDNNIVSALDTHAPFKIVYYSGLAWLLFTQIRLWLDLRQAQKNREDQLISWSLSSLFALVVPVILSLLIDYLTPEARSIYRPPMALSLAIGLLTFYDTFWRRRRLSMPRAANPLDHLAFYMKAGVLLFVLSFVTFQMGLVTGISLNLVLITIVAIGPMMPESTLTSVVSLPDALVTNYRMAGIAAGLSIAVPILYFLLFFWTLRNLRSFMGKYGQEYLEAVRAVWEKWKSAREAKRSRSAGQ